MRTQVAIVGAGPAGLLLSQLLHRAGIDSIVLEQRSAAHVLGRIRAGVLERSTADLLDEAGVGERMHRDGLVHLGIGIAFDGVLHRLDFDDLVGESIVVYGQTEITRDLMEARIASGGDLVYEAADVSIHDFDGDGPRVRYRKDGVTREIRCDFIAGCDGFHGVCRQSVPPQAIRTYEKIYPFGWLGILAHTRPLSDEVVYANHERGFALASMRSKTLSRYYIQCRVDENPDQWPDQMIWDELGRRFGPDLAPQMETGPSVEKSVAPLRSFVAEPMRFGRLFLAGDAAHIVPPTGAKGLNLAASDVRYLSRALIAYYASNATQGLDSYSADCLGRVWRAERFSWSMTMLLHRFPDQSEFERKIQLADFDHLMRSRAAMTAVAENYVGR